MVVSQQHYLPYVAKVYFFYNNNDLPNSGDFSAFCANGSGTCTNALSFINTNNTEEVKLFNELNLSILPNPAKYSASIDYFLPANTSIKLTIFNAQGQLVHSLLNNDKAEKGHHQYTLSLTDFNSGIYFVALTTKNKVMLKKIVILE